MDGRGPLAVTCGDPSGIGLDITIAAWRARRDNRLAPFVLLADFDVLEARSRTLGMAGVARRITDPSLATEIFTDALPVMDVDEPLGAAVVAGRPDVANAPHVLAAIRQAVRLTAQGTARAVVTNPVAKHVLYGPQFSYPGQTEFLAALAGEYYGCGDQPTPHPLMLLWSEALAVVPLTTHIPIVAVPPRVTASAIRQTIVILNRAMQRDFGIVAPRIAVAGLNPHAGEEGTIGREDVDVIAPTIAALREIGINVSGPYSADTLFHAKARQAYDVAVTMYHDQALIPLKTLAFETGVNVTLGLPFIRTSPDHGTAFDLAGTGEASPSSLISALKLADRLSQTRASAVVDA